MGTCVPKCEKGLKALTIALILRTSLSPVLLAWGVPVAG